MAKIIKIISGGQTGADLGGLMAGNLLGIKTGGTAPINYRTETGFNKLLKTKFNLEESFSSDYKERTIQNINDSDCTIIFMDKISAGSVLTRKKCEMYKKRFIINPTKEEMISWLNSFDNDIILNVAGNRESVSPGISERVRLFLIDVIKENQGE